VKIIDCPLNGPCNAQEFICGGEVKTRPSGLEAADSEWVDYIYLENNTMGVVMEWWCHLASSYWFIVERDTATDTIIRTYPASELLGPAATGIP
jgi:sarcosine oxidase subunit delta